jgi:hypothetical protein
LYGRLFDAREVPSVTSMSKPVHSLVSYSTTQTAFSGRVSYTARRINAG